MSHDAIIEWGFTIVIFGLLGLICLQMMLPLVAMTLRPKPKDEPKQLPNPRGADGILAAMNDLEALIDWRQGNTDSNLILDNSKWKLYRRAMDEYGILPVFNQKTGKWVEFDGTFRLIDTMNF